jgi:hypothetical protein
MNDERGTSSLCRSRHAVMGESGRFCELGSRKTRSGESSLQGQTQIKGGSMGRKGGILGMQ